MNGDELSEVDAHLGPEADFQAVIELVGASRGFDVTGYKPSSVRRRVQRRMQDVGAATYADYADYLELHGEEFARLFDALLINVTSFFRDPATWEHVREAVIPQLLDLLPDGAPVRVWSAGCASGEEAYTLAILFAEVMGSQAARGRVKIYATDLDDDALNQARQAVYSARDLEAVPADYRQRYFVRRGAGFQFAPDLRRMVIFGHHDLSQDAPISRVSLLVCRNTLMYFTSERQARIVARLHFALQDDGHLILGRAEMLLSHARLFTPSDLGLRVFRKVTDTNLRSQLLTVAESGQPQAVGSLRGGSRLNAATFDVNPVAEAVIAADGTLQMVNRAAMALFGLRVSDLGRPFQDVELSYRPMELRSHLKQVMGERHPVDAGEVRQDGGGDAPPVWLDVRLTPVMVGGEVLGVSATFRDVTSAKRLQHELERSNRELDTAYEELHSTNEELETANEELQSTLEEQETTNEELQSTNEELQSTNEELETLNEELQSTNVELNSMNDELSHKSAQLDQVNGYLESILATLGAAVAVVDRELVVVIWTEQAEELWGLRVDEVQGANLLNLDIGLPVEELRQPIREALADDGPEHAELALEATNRRGRRIRCAITVRAMRGRTDADFRGAVIMMEEVT